MMLLLYNVLLKVDGNAADGFLLNALKLSIVPLEDDAQEKKKKGNYCHTENLPNSTLSNSIKQFSSCVTWLSTEFQAFPLSPRCLIQAPGDSPVLSVKILQLLMCCSACIDGDAEIPGSASGWLYLPALTIPHFAALHRNASLCLMLCNRMPFCQVCRLDFKEKKINLKLPLY